MCLYWQIDTLLERDTTQRIISIHFHLRFWCGSQFCKYKAFMFLSIASKPITYLLKHTEKQLLCATGATCYRGHTYWAVSDLENLISYFLFLSLRIVKFFWLFSGKCRNRRMISRHIAETHLTGLYNTRCCFVTCPLGNPLKEKQRWGTNPCWLHFLGTLPQSHLTLEFNSNRQQYLRDSNPF